MTLEEVAPTLRATILAHCRLGGFEPNIRFEVQLQQTVLSLVDEGRALRLCRRRCARRNWRASCSAGWSTPR